MKHNKTEKMYHNLLSKLEGLTTDCGKVYWIRSAIYLDEDVCVNQFIQARLNFVFNYLFMPNEQNTLALRAIIPSSFVLLRDFVEKKYINSAQILHVVNTISANSSIQQRYNATLFLSKYINDYFEFLNKKRMAIDVFSIIKLDYVKNKFIKYIMNGFNEAHKRYAINKSEIDKLFDKSDLCISKVIKDKLRVIITQPWESAIYIKVSV